MEPQWWWNNKWGSKPRPEIRLYKLKPAGFSDPPGKTQVMVKNDLEFNRHHIIHLFIVEPFASPPAVKQKGRNRTKSPRRIIRLTWLPDLSGFSQTKPGVK